MKLLDEHDAKDLADLAEALVTHPHEQEPTIALMREILDGVEEDLSTIEICRIGEGRNRDDL